MARRTSDSMVPMEGREVRKVQPGFAAESRVSSSHPDFNEDAVFGDLERIRRERQAPPGIRTADSAKDLAALAAAGRKEEKFAEMLRDRRVFAVLDGVSGSGNGGGLLASRIASAEISETMALASDTDPELARKSIETALHQAHRAVMEYKYGRPFADVLAAAEKMEAEGGDPDADLPATAERGELVSMATTVDLVKSIPRPDGGFDVAYGHAGDSRIYVFDAASGELRCETIDDGPAGEELRAGRISRAEYDLVMSANGADELPDARLKLLFRHRNAVMGDRVVGAKPQFKPTSGVFRAKAGERIVMTTDGIHDNLTPVQMRDILAKGGGAKELAAAAAEIMASASARAKPDDLTVAEVLLEGGERSRPEAAESGSARSEAAARAESAREEAASLATLLERADAGDVDALTKVKDKYEGRDNVIEKILIMRNRALAKEKESLAGDVGGAALARLAEIVREQQEIKEEMMRHVARHERQIKESMELTYDLMEGEDAAAERPLPPSAPEPQAPKRSWWDRLTGKR